MTKKNSELSRRDFVKKGSAGMAAATAAANLTWLSPSAYAQAGATALRLGIVGCGGRGTGAVFDNLLAAEELDLDVKIVAMADLAPDRLASSRETMLEEWQGKGRYDVKDDHIFVGVNSYKQLCELDDVDIVIQTTPPGLRFLTLDAAVKNGKHSFVEKPVCVDADTYRLCLAAGQQAKEKGLAVVSGTQYRRETSYIEAIDRMQNGLIGDITGGFEYYCSSTQWHRGRGPEGDPWTEMEYQMRNWPYFTWLSGDLIAEQSIHNIDAVDWLMQGPPVRAYASGGRTARTAEEYGNVYDNFSVDYDYQVGNSMVRFSFKGRQWPNAANRIENLFVGTKGTLYLQPNPGRTRWIAKDHDGGVIASNRGNDGNNQPYVEEHKQLLKSIVDGEPIMEIKDVADSSMTAIIGREAAYTGRDVLFDWMANDSQLKLRPDAIEPGKDIQLGEVDLPHPNVPIPGTYRLQ
ncbi:MAG: Gfo/Idh/MocA family oxidoreductase [Planctomycetota bacterium]